MVYFYFDIFEHIYNIYKVIMFIVQVLSFSRDCKQTVSACKLLETSKNLTSDFRTVSVVIFETNILYSACSNKGH